jgi:SAM-dependent methyltransferase
MSTFPDFVRAANIADNPDTYQRENEAIDPSGALWNGLRQAADWAGRTVLDLGCGSGFWLPRYAETAARVTGVEPDDTLLERARDAAAGDPTIDVLPGSAERLPLADHSVDVVHARFAYFFAPRCGPGLREVLRVLRPTGTFVVIDNDLRHGEFAELLRESPWAAPQGTADVTDAWWVDHGARRVEVMSAWSCASGADLESILRIEFPAEAVDAWVRRHPGQASLSYGYALFVVDGSTGDARPAR